MTISVKFSLLHGVLLCYHILSDLINIFKTFSFRIILNKLSTPKFIN